MAAMSRFLLCLLGAGLLFPASAEAQDVGSTDGTPIAIGQRRTIRSEVLEEERPYWVYLPPSYDDTRYAPTDYPVLYLLDGDAHFHTVTGVVHFMSAGINGNLQIPELIVVAVPNTDRTRDLTPTRNANRPTGGDDPSLRGSGGGDAFLAFLRDELILGIDAAYRTKPYRVLVGHSFGGLLSMHALLNEPELFQAHIAIDPSVFWDDHVLVKRLLGLGRDPGKRPRVVYLSLSNQPATSRMAEAVEAFAAGLDAWRSPRVRSTLERFELETHGSVPLLSLYHGLGFVFEGYRVTTGQMFDRPETIASHFTALSEKLGTVVLPPERFLDQMGHAFLRQNFVDKAVSLFTVNASSHPASFSVHDSLAQALAVQGEIELAIGSYERALELNPDNHAARDALQRLRPR